MSGPPYTLLGPDGAPCPSDWPGTLGGNGRARVYGRLGCRSADRALAKGYAQHRVFFADEAIAIAAGYRPCGTCMRETYRAWKRGGTPGSAEYPWLVSPKQHRRA